MKAENSRVYVLVKHHDHHQTIIDVFYTQDDAVSYANRLHLPFRFVWRDWTHGELKSSELHGDGLWYSVERSLVKQ